MLKPRGTFGLYEVMRTGEGELAFPVAWAHTYATLFVEGPPIYRRALEAAGIEVMYDEDRSRSALEFFHHVRARLAESGPPPLGLHLHMGPEAPRKVVNMIENLERALISPIEMICRRR